MRSLSAADSISDTANDLTQLSLEDLMKIEVATVYGASKFEQKTTEAPSSITIVTSDEIKKYGHRTLADILKSVSGFYITYDRNYYYIGVRGFGRTGDYNSRILVLIDGYRINDSLYNGALVGTEFILDIDLIDRVEIIRGPGSSLYGNNAFFAVINIITKKGRDIKGLEASAEAGSLQSYKGRLTYGNRFDNEREVLFSASAYDSNGHKRLYFREYDDPATNNGIAQNLDKDKYHNLFSSISFGDFTVQGAYVSRKKFVPTASYSTVFNDPRFFTIDRQGYVSLKYSSNIYAETAVTARLYYGIYDYAGDYPYTGVLNKDTAWARWWGGEFQLTKKLFERHKLIFGAEYQDNIRQDQRNYNEDPYLPKLDDKKSSTNTAFYVQDEFRILDNLTLNAGLRHDNRKYGSRTSPRAALIYGISSDTAIKLLYGEAFRAPNVYELYYHDGYNTAKPNPALVPEVIKTYEMVLEHYLKKNLRMSLSGFYYRIDSLITQETDTDGLLVFNNADKIETKGMEFEMQHRWQADVEGRASYTFQEARSKRTRQWLTNSPKHLAKLNAIIPVLKGKLFSGTEIQYTSSRRTLKNNRTSGFIVANLSLVGKNVTKGMDVSASLYNLFDKKFKDPGGGEHTQDAIEQDDRAFRLKLTYRF